MFLPVYRCIVLKMSPNSEYKKPISISLLILDRRDSCKSFSSHICNKIVMIYFKRVEFNTLQCPKCLIIIENYCEKFNIILVQEETHIGVPIFRKKRNLSRGRQVSVATQQERHEKNLYENEYAVT